MRQLSRHFGSLLVTLIATLIPAVAYAAGPLDVCRPGIPFRWPSGGANIPFNPDQGPLGPLSNAQATTLVAEAFAAWGEIPSATTSYQEGAPLPVNVTLANFSEYFSPKAPDGLSAIVYDDDGAIFDMLFGPGSGVLGFAGPEWLDEDTCAVLEGMAFLNGGAISGPTNLEEARDVMVHEFGHYQNLAHTVVNGQVLLGDTTGPTPFDTFPIADLIAVLNNAVETMYPFYFGPGSGTASPHKDDIASLSALYPAPSFAASTATITGRILASNRRTPKTGFNVIARNVANPFLDAVSALSSDYTDVFTPGAPLVGVYTLRGLTPGAEYAIYVDGILDGGFSTPPGVLPGPEEFYNGQNEDNDSVNDVPNNFVTISVPSGQRRTDVNIVFNRFRPNETLPLQDDSAFELALPFTFHMCGIAYDELFVNANGTLSFGAPNASFAESEAGFLAGPAQIAGAWDDLTPVAAGARVFFTENPWEFTVTFDAVPERGANSFTGIGSNTFSITLKRLLSQIEIAYGGLTMSDGLAGVSCGGAIASGFEQPIDLSERADRFRINLLFRPAVYERFLPAAPPEPGSPNDLSNLTLRFTPTTPYSDFWSENNDTLEKATRISLPFDSIPVARFTEIGREGDVDFYRFRARAGQVITAEILSSQLDTVLGLFNRTTGELLAVDDDSGPGPLSKITRFEIPADGEYAVAVSTFPDFEFEGSSGDTGRYVLSVSGPTSLTETAQR
jgi:Bacterial pre-peptidase C-terminal domain